MNMQEAATGNNQNDTNNNNSQESEQGSAGEEKICRDYQRGVCNRGGKCKFQHPDGMGTEIVNQPMICRDFQNGKCSRSTCKYLHITNSQERVFLQTGQVPPQAGADRPAFPREAPPFHGGEATRAGPQDPVCKDYLNRKCTRGPGCRFRHVFEDGSGGGGGGGGGGGFEFDNPAKRRRDSYDGQPNYYLVEENESLRRKVADLQKQVATLKATNEVLLEQNARYRTQAGGGPGAAAPYSSSNHNSQRPSDYSQAPGYPSSSNPPSYGTSYPPRDSYYSTQANPPPKEPYNASKDGYSASYNSGYASIYTKFD